MRGIEADSLDYRDQKTSKDETESACDLTRMSADSCRQPSGSVVLAFEPCNLLSRRKGREGISYTETMRRGSSED
jgi:hypothetical protein